MAISGDQCSSFEAAKIRTLIRNQNFRYPIIDTRLRSQPLIAKIGRESSTNNFDTCSRCWSNSSRRKLASAGRSGFVRADVGGTIRTSVEAECPLIPSECPPFPSPGSAPSNCYNFAVAGKTISLERKQQLYFDGIEYSFRFVREVYARLIATMKEDTSETGDLWDLLVADCWTIIDLAKRLHTLVQFAPGIKRTPEVELFLRATSHVPDFRHYIQHMDGEAAGVAATGLPIWASFSWIVLKEKDSEGKQHFEILMYMPGRLGSCQVPVVNPLGREHYDTIDHIQLSTYGGSIDISELVRTISRFEITLMPAIKSAESTGTRDGKGLIRVVPGSAARMN